MMLHENITIHVNKLKNIQLTTVYLVVLVIIHRCRCLPAIASRLILRPPPSRSLEE